LNEDDPHAFIQIINGITNKSEYIRYPVNEFCWDNKRLQINIGNSVFTDKYINLDIDKENLRIYGHVDYCNIVNYPKSFLSPGIMGWYSFIPFVKCKHGIVSVNHDLNGSITVNNVQMNFDGGKGYIEKDWGTSFPEAWLWIQANNFRNWSSSFSFSMAKIPWRGKFFIGFIAFLHFNKKFLLFSTYNNSVVKELKHFGDSIDLILKNKYNTLKINTHKSVFGEPLIKTAGNISGNIHGSNYSFVSLSLYDTNNNIIYSDSSLRAGIEVIEKIFDYVK
jgi:tocopherol cyclase